MKDALGIILFSFVSFYYVSCLMALSLSGQALSDFVSLRSSVEHATDVRSTAVVNEACINCDNQSNLDCLTTDCNFEFKYQIVETLE